MDKELVERYYDKHSRTKFVKNFVRGNKRIERLKWYIRNIAPRNAKSVLVIGCASGEICHWLARHVTKRAMILGVDISSDYIEIAKRLYAHPNVEYRVANAIEQLPGEPVDLVLLLDVFEHIPATDRNALLDNLLPVCHDGTRLLLTCPSPAHQRFLIDRGWGLQPVDELIELNDFESAASSLGFQITNFMSACVHRYLDYNYVLMEKAPLVCRPLRPVDKVMLRACPPKTMWGEIRKALRRVFWPSPIRRRVRAWYLKSRLSGAGPIRRWHAPVAVGGAAMVLATLAAAQIYRSDARTDAKDLKQVLLMTGDLREKPLAEIVLIDSLPSGYQNYFSEKVTYIDDDDLPGILREMADKEHDYFIVETNSSQLFDKLNRVCNLAPLGNIGDFVLYGESVKAEPLAAILPQ